MAPSAADMFGYGDELRRFAERMDAQLAPYREMQRQMEVRLAPFLEMQKRANAQAASFRKMQEQTEKHIRPFLRIQEQLQKQLEPLKQIQETFRKQAEPFRRMQEQAKKFNEPFLRFQEQARQMTEPLLRMQKQLEPLLQMQSRLASSLQGYNPTFETADDKFVVDGNTYTVEDINQAVSGLNTLESKWNAIPKPLQWLIIVILTFMLQDAYNSCKNWMLTQVSYLNSATICHHQKQEIRAIKQEVKASATNSVSPFVSQDNLAVYAASKRHSRIITYLPFKTEITILEYRKKKRWLLVEWNVDGQVNRGWVLGRYVFRPSKYRRTN